MNQTGGGFRISIFLYMFVVILFGLTAIYSSAYALNTIDIFKKQVSWVLLSSFIGFILYFLPYRIFYNLAYYVYGISLVMLVAVLFVGKKAGGAVSWFSFGFISFQPAEIVKITCILALARYTSAHNFSIKNIANFFGTVLIVLTPVTLIMLQPDTGTSLTFFPVLIAIMLFSGLNIFISMLAVLPFVVAIIGFLNLFIALGFLVIVYTAMFFIIRKKILYILSLVFALIFCFGSNFYIKQILKPHQISRINSFINPDADARGTGYNSMQARIAIGGGGIFGKGYLQGSQTQLRFIPAQSTDFIFCILAEELGFIAVVTLVLFLFLILYGMITLIFKINNRFCQRVMVGIATLLFVHIFINLGMVMGILPVIGIPLPFVSYGGSSILAFICSIAIVENFARNVRSIPLN